jgi:hypothetical protein
LLLPPDDRVKERVFLYADDVVLFLQPQQQDLAMTKGILEIFAHVSGLRTNLDTCLISPIQCNLEDTVLLLRHCPGKLDPFRTKYLLPRDPAVHKKIAKVWLAAVNWQSKWSPPFLEIKASKQSRLCRAH